MKIKKSASLLHKTLKKRQNNIVKKIKLRIIKKMKTMMKKMLKQKKMMTAYSLHSQTSSLPKKR
jgi:hypothetical protein